MRSKFNISKWLTAAFISASTVLYSLATLGDSSQIGDSGPSSSTVGPEEFWMYGCTDMYFLQGQNRAAIVSDGSIYFHPFWLKGRTLVKVVPWEGGSMSADDPKDILAPAAPDWTEFPEPFPGCIKEGTLYWDQYTEAKQYYEAWLKKNP